MSSGHQRTLWSLKALHLLLALSIPFVLSFFMGCKRAKEEKADLGPQFTAAQIDEALNKVIKGASLDGLRVGEYLNYVILRRIENADTTMLIGGTNVSIIAAGTTSDHTETKYTLQINKAYRKEDGSFQNVVSEDNLLVRNAPGLSTSSLAEWAKSVRASSVSGNVQATSKPLRYTYHKLSEGDESMPPPDKVRAKPDCGGLTSCEIPLHYIRFDMVSWYSDTDYQKVSFDFGFSARTPFLPFGAGFDQFSGVLVVDCRSTYIQLETRSVYVRDCQQLEDFQK